jgi:galactonate dehydratase
LRPQFRTSRGSKRASRRASCHGFDNPELFPGLLALEGVYYRVNDKPGVDVDEALAAKQSCRQWEAPHLVRKDGSVTNW